MNNLVRFILGLIITGLYILLAKWVLEEWHIDFVWVFFSIIPFVLGFIKGSFRHKMPEFIGFTLAALFIPILIFIDLKKNWIMIPVGLLLPVFVLLVFLGALLRQWLGMKGILRRKTN